MFTVKTCKFILKVTKFQRRIVYRFSTAEGKAMAVGGFHPTPPGLIRVK